MTLMSHAQLYVLHVHVSDSIPFQHQLYIIHGHKIAIYRRNDIISMTAIFSFSDIGSCDLQWNVISLQLFDSVQNIL